MLFFHALPVFLAYSLSDHYNVCILNTSRFKTRYTYKFHYLIFMKNIYDLIKYSSLNQLAHIIHFMTFFMLFYQVKISIIYNQGIAWNHSVSSRFHMGRSSIIEHGSIYRLIWQMVLNPTRSFFEAISDCPFIWSITTPKCLSLL